MGLNRWLKYAKAKVDSTLARGNDELARREAEREVELADKPWLGADGEDPTLDEARARIEYEVERNRRASSSAGGSASGAANPPTTAGPTPPAPGSPTPSDSTSGRTAAEEAELAAAKITLDQREAEAKRRLEQMREELRGDGPPG